MPDNQQQVEHSPHTFAVSEYQEQQLDEIKGLKLLTVMIALCLAVFCVALDNTVRPLPKQLHHVLNSHRSSPLPSQKSRISSRLSKTLVGMDRPAF